MPNSNKRCEIQGRQISARLESVTPGESEFTIGKTGAEKTHVHQVRTGFWDLILYLTISSGSSPLNHNPIPHVPSWLSGKGEIGLCILFPGA